METFSGLRLIAVGEPLLSWLGLFAAFFLIILNGFFVASEFALGRVREARIQQLEEARNSQAAIVRRTLRELGSYLLVCQVGITVSSLALGWVAAPAVSRLVGPVLEGVGITNEGVVGVVSVILGFAVIAYAHLVFGEQAPKYFALRRAEATSLRISRPLTLFMLLFRPLVWVVNSSTNFVLKPWRIRVEEEAIVHSEEELRLMINSSAASGELEPEERDYLYNVFDFTDKVAREIMVPRPDVEALPHDAPLAELAQAAAFGRYTRYPVYEGDLDSILGSVHIKDLFRAANEQPENFELRPLVRDCIVVPENKPIEELLKEFQRRKLQMAIVIDEWGSVEGLLTIEDVLEELVGEIQDEFDRDEAAIEKLGENLFAIDGRITIEEVNERFGLGLQHEDFDTIGGYVLGALGRPPKMGDPVEVDGVTFTVKSVDGARVSMLTLNCENYGNHGYH